MHVDGEAFVQPHDQAPEHSAGRAHLPVARPPVVRHGVRKPVTGTRILWIDDEVIEGDATVTMLSLEGFAVDVARSGVEGLALAAANAYRAVIVDLKLADVPGLELLRRLRSAGVAAPVMVLSGYLDVEACEIAVRLGVADIKSKPVFGDDLADALRVILAASAERTLRRPALRRPIGRRPAPSRHALLAHVARALTRPDMPPSEYVELTVRFRRFIGGRQSDARLRRGTLPCAGTSGTEHLGKVLAAIEQELGLGRLPEIAGIADALRADPEDVADLIQALLGCTFRECRRALRLRRSLAVVASGDEQYAQIAYRLGYEHPAQFTRDFGATFGLSPSEFRALVAPPAPPEI